MSFIGYEKYLNRRNNQPKMTTTIDIRELDPDMIEPSMEHANDPNYQNGGSKITVIGRPGTGKSYLITSLIYEKRACFPTGLVISGTEDSNKHFSQYFPETFIYTEMDLEVLKNFIQRQKLARQYLPQSWALLLLDDCMSDTRVFNSPIIQGLYKNGRHWNMLYILSLQYCMDIKPVIRNNIDGTFILREPSVRFRKSIYENYASIIPTFKLFCFIMDQITNDWTALYINNRVQSNDWQDCVFWYRGVQVPSNWKFGSSWYWQFHRDRYNAQRG
jgi:hypothetical protein